MVKSGMSKLTLGKMEKKVFILNMQVLCFNAGRDSVIYRDLYGNAHLFVALLNSVKKHSGFVRK